MSLLFAMFSFSLAMSISPGPVNFVIVSSGASYGVRKTFRFVSGATIGFTLLLAFIGFGFHQVLELYPAFLKYLTIAGALFIVYMGYLIATSKPELKLEQPALRTFSQGFLLQWLNPKAWMACVSGVSLFSAPEDSTQFITFLLIYFTVCYLSLFAWSLLGDKATLLLNTELKLKLFNWLMGALLVVTAGFLLVVQFG